MKYVVAYATTAVAFLVIDLMWLGVVAKSFYRDRIGALMLDRVNWSAAILFYAVYIVGIVIFAVAPALNAGSWRHALMFGALFGFFCYATYDMTNLATLRGWPISMAIVDIVWGTFLTAACATAGYVATAWLLRAASGS